MQTQWVGVRREVENCVPAASPLPAAVGSSTAAAAAAAAAVAGGGCGVVGVPGRYTTSTMIGAVPSCTAGWSAAAAAASSSFAATTTAVAVAAAAAACSPTSCFSAAALSGNGSTLPEPSRCCWCDSDDALGCVDAAAASLPLLSSSTPSGCAASDVGGVTPLRLC